MAFDPIQEDCLRLVLAAMRRAHLYPLDDAAFIEEQTDAYQADPARLIHTDRDRSFHLVARATELIDYRIPFLTDDAEAERLAAQAEHHLREAVELDAGNWDAKRMLAALTAPSNDAYVTYLRDHRAAVEDDLAAFVARASDPYDREYASDLARRPYLRWLAALAARALIAGHYRLALSVAEESLALAPADPGGIRHTGMLALGKLEASPQELRQYRQRHASSYAPVGSPRGRRHQALAQEFDAWSLLVEMSAHWRAFDIAAASRTLRALLRVYPHAAPALYYQAEFPDGVFARVNVEPASEDELVLALSEATPLLQEGVGAPDSASFATWIAESEPVQRALERTDAQQRAAAGAPPRGGER